MNLKEGGHRAKAFFILLIVMLSFTFNIGFVNSTSSTPSVVDTGTDLDIVYTYTDSTFFDENSNRTWIFYYDDDSNNIEYKYSMNGENWVQPTNSPAVSVDLYYNHFSVYWCQDISYVYLVWVLYAGAAGGEYIYLRRGLFNGGTTDFDWEDIRQVQFTASLPNGVLRNPDVIVDTWNSKVIVVWGRMSGSYAYPRYKISTNLVANSWGSATNLATLSTSNCSPELLFLRNETNHLRSDIMCVFYAHQDLLSRRYYITNQTWGSEKEIYGTGDYGQELSHKTAYYNGSLHSIYREAPSTGNITTKLYDATTNAWGTETQVTNADLVGYGQGVGSFGNSSIEYVFYAYSDAIYYCSRAGEESAFTAPTMWFNITGLSEGLFNTWVLEKENNLSYIQCSWKRVGSDIVEFAVFGDDPWNPPPSEAYYDVELRILVNGYEPYTNITFDIDGTDYANGQTANLLSLVYVVHNLTGTSVTSLTFINWTVEGSITVANANDPTTFLYVSGTGTLTQHLNATVDILHNSTTITNMNADTWLFAEYRFYAFQSQYILTNSYIDTVQWSFLDFASHNVTFYFNNATTEAVLYGPDYISLRNNGSATYNWLNLTAQTVTVTVWVWVKINIIDSLYVDLYVQGNCSGYGLTNSTDGWVKAQSEYFNLYSRGGAEELTIGTVEGGMSENSSVAAGRSGGGDIFNLYAYNNTFALSEQYWRNLVHVKVLFEFKWNHATITGLPWDAQSADFPIDLHYQLGWTYYANGNWSENRFSRIDLKLVSFGWGANHQFSRWDIKIVHGGVQVYSDEILGWFDEHSKSYKVWMDLWFNSANASSIAGARATSYWYGVYNTAAWWARVFTGNDWGVLNENETSHLGFGMLRDEGDYTQRIFSSEIELVKLWCRMYQSGTAYNYSASIWKIEIFDKVFNENSMGIATPPFEAPHMPSMPMGGFLGVIYSALMWLAEMSGPGLMQFWYIFVGFLDGTIGAWLGQPTFFSWFFEQINLFFDYMVNSVAYYLSIFGSFMLFLGAMIGKFAGLVGTAFETWASMFTLFISILDTGLDSGINIWNDLGLSSWLILGLILYPISLLVLWEEEGLEALIAQITFIINVLAFLMNLLLRVAQFGINIIHYIIESIPVVE